MPRLILPGQKRINWDLLGTDAFVYGAEQPSRLITFAREYAGTEIGGTDAVNSFSQSRKWSVTDGGVDFGAIQPWNTASGGVSLLFAGTPVADAANRQYAVTQRLTSSPYIMLALNTQNTSAVNAGAISFMGANTGASVAFQYCANDQFDGAFHTWVFSTTGSSRSVARDGILQSITTFSSGAISSSFTSASQKFKVSATADATGQNRANPYGTSLIVGWSKAISSELQIMLSMNPELVYESPATIIFLPAVAASALDGAAQAATTVTGTINAALAMSGASVVIASATGAVNQSVGLSGAAASVSIVDGIATITATLSGDGFVESFSSGALASALAMEAAASAAATASGDLSAGGDLAGSAASQSTATGSVSLSVSLSSDALIQALASANLDAGLQDALSGDASASASASAALFQSIEVLGNATVIVTGSGGVASTQTLAGEALVSSLSGGDLQVSTMGLSANAIVEALAGGSISFVLNLSADALASALAPSTLTVGDIWSGLLLDKYTITTTERNYTMAQERNYTIEAAA